MGKINRKRVPYRYWPDIQERYNKTYNTSLTINALRGRLHRNDDLKILEVIADVVQEKKQEAAVEAQRIESKLLSANMI